MGEEEKVKPEQVSVLSRDWRRRACNGEQEASTRDGTQLFYSWREEMRLQVQDELNSRRGKARTMRQE